MKNPEDWRGAQDTGQATELSDETRVVYVIQGKEFYITWNMLKKFGAMDDENYQTRKDPLGNPWYNALDQANKEKLKELREYEKEKREKAA